MRGAPKSVGLEQALRLIISPEAPLDEALLALPCQRSVVFRGVDRALARRYKVGTEITWSSFSSTALVGEQRIDRVIAVSAREGLAYTPLRYIVAPVLAALVTGGGVMALGVPFWASGLCYALCGFTAMTVVREFWGGAQVRREATGTDVPAALSGLEGVQQVLPDGQGAWKVVADRDVRAAINRAAEFASESPEPAASELYTDVLK